MKRLKTLTAVSIFISFMFFLGVSAASAQLLDDVWFKIRAKCKGHEVDNMTGAYQRNNFSFTVYLHFNWNAGSGEYTVNVWTKTNSGWNHTDTPDPFEVVGIRENFISDFYLYLEMLDGDYIDTYHTPFINTKLDNSGAFKRAKYKGTGEIYYGEFDGGSTMYYGYVKFNGKSVDVPKLPFSP